jgi:acetyl-CoA carboxylase biotin carboxyl carrier protein
MSKDEPKAPSGNKINNRPGVDADAIRELSQLLNETGLTEIEIDHNGARIRVSRAAVNAVMGAGAASATPPAPGPALAAGPAGPSVGAVPSPMVGTVYLSPEPGKPPFISVGKPVTEGDTLFIVEAMKTMNPITAPRAGTVREICVADGNPVEFGQTLAVIA